MIHTKSHNRLKEDYVFKIAAIKYSLVEHKKPTKDAIFKKYGKIIDVDNKLAMDAVYGNNIENPTMNLNLVAVMVTLKTVTATTASVTVVV
jgi:hypothetical protein